MRALITGATGFVGRHLLAQLPGTVHVLSRDAAKAERTLAKFDVRAFAWDSTGDAPIPAAAFDGVDVVFNLAGESIAEGKWTDEKKRRIRDSRVVGTRRLVEAISVLEPRPRTLVSASAVGWYGDCGDRLLTEDEPPASDFLGSVCVEWEREAMRAEAAGLRVVTPRLGVVLGRDGGALEKMLPVFKWGAGGKLGSGEQYIPWIHIEDLVRLLLFAAAHESLSGPVNATSPNPVTNAHFTKAMGEATHRPTLFGAPKFALKALAGEMSDLLLYSQRVIPAKALAAGFTFLHPEIEGALEELIDR
jgi:uncharacterized protein (TIGR01777 family)